MNFGIIYITEFNAVHVRGVNLWKHFSIKRQNVTSEAVALDTSDHFWSLVL